MRIFLLSTQFENLLSVVNVTYNDHQFWKSTQFIIYSVWKSTQFENLLSVVNVTDNDHQFWKSTQFIIYSVWKSTQFDNEVCCGLMLMVWYSAMLMVELIFFVKVTSINGILAVCGYHDFSWYSTVYYPQFFSSICPATFLYLLCML